MPPDLHARHFRQAQNYAQWESADAYRAMLENPVAQEHMHEAADLADGFEPLVRGGIRESPLNFVCPEPI